MLHYSNVNIKNLILTVFLLFPAIPGIQMSDAFAQDKAPPADSKEFKKYYDLGMKHYNKEECEEAIEAFKKALQIDPKSADSHFKIARCYKRLDKIVESTKSYEKGIEINPDASYAIYFHLGMNYFNLKNYPKAIESFEKAVKINPDANYSAYFTLATSYFNNKDYENAIKNFQKSIKKKPNYELAHFYLSKSYEKLGNYPEAIKALDEGLKQLPNSLTIMDSLAWLLATSPSDESRDPKRAVRLAERAVDFSKGEDPVILDTLAAAYAEAGRYQDAVKTQEKALNLAKNLQATSGGDESLIGQFNKRLTSYKENKPWRDQ